MRFNETLRDLICDIVSIFVRFTAFPQVTLGLLTLFHTAITKAILRHAITHNLCDVGLLLTIKSWPIKYSEQPCHFISYI